ncbi:DUF4166 domain-containing protein [Sphaerisporangium sp. NBC_01403]|uniref:DUF4166 domain-containing protein n=1 Tax=Sphaerisporangium sp. NBC_01403 TaxID=2903599 RepID=UPI003255FFCC
MSDEAYAWMCRFHLGDETVSGIGVLEVLRGPGPLGRLACAVLGFPRTCTAVPARVTVRRSPGEGQGRVVERWERTIGARRLVSVQSREGERGWERHGPLEIRTRTVASPGEVDVVQVGAVLRMGGREIPLPEPLAPRVFAHAWVEAGDRDRRPPRFHVAVRVTVPVVGVLISYRGHLREERPERRHAGGPGAAAREVREPREGR